MIRIMSFNIRCGNAQDEAQSWDHRKGLVIDRIRLFNPDLLGLQECRDDEQALFIRSRLYDYEMIGTPRYGGGETALEMAPLLYHRDRFYELDRGWFWLSETPNQPGSKDWNSAFPRTVTWARLRPKWEAGGELIFMNTHFDYNNLEVKDQSARLVRHWIEQRSHTPLILTGDFNALKDSNTYDILVHGEGDQAASQVDPFAVLHPNEALGSFHGFGLLPEPAAIDWILASKTYHPVSAVIDTYRSEVIFPSDHYPLLAVVQPG